MTANNDAHTADGLWRRAVRALSHVFEGDPDDADETSVFQTRDARARTARLGSPPIGADDIPLKPVHRGIDVEDASR